MLQLYVHDQKHIQKAKMSTEMSSLTLYYLENMYNNIFYDKIIFGHGLDKFSNLADGDHLEILYLDNSFPIALWRFYTKVII